MRAATAHLGDIAEINPAISVRLSGDVPCNFVPMEAVDEVSARITHVVMRPYQDVAKGYTRFAESDVLLAKITPCMENGKCAIARDLVNGVGFGSTEFHVLRASPRVLPEWLFYYWRLPETRSRAEENMTGSAGQKRVPTAFLEELELPLPDQAEQIRWAALLARTERLLRTRRFALELNDQALREAFVRLFGTDAGSLSLVPVEKLAVDGPNAIRTGPFGSQLLHSEFTTEGVAVLGIDNAVNNRFVWAKRRFITSAKYEELKRYTAQPGDVLITIMGTCGRCAVVPDGIGTAINTKHLCCITLDQSRSLPVFLHGAFLYHPFVRRQLRLATKGAIMDGLNMQIIRELRIPLPSVAMQHKWARIAAAHERLRLVQQEALRQADHLFGSLLAEAFAADSARSRPAIDAAPIFAR